MEQMSRATRATVGFLLGIGALALLTVALALRNGHCTGPASPQPCDFVARAKVATQRFGSFDSRLGIEVFDRGSSVLVQQTTPKGYEGIYEGPATLIDKRSCRVCSAIGNGHIPEPLDRRDVPRGAVLLMIPPESPI